MCLLEHNALLSTDEPSVKCLLSAYRRALVVAPKTLLAHWEKELGVCGLASLTHEYYGTSQCARCGNFLQSIHYHPLSCPARCIQNNRVGQPRICCRMLLVKCLNRGKSCSLDGRAMAALHAGVAMVGHITDGWIHAPVMQGGLSPRGAEEGRGAAHDIWHDPAQRCCSE